MTVTAPPRTTLLSKLHPAYLAKLACSIFAGILGVHLMVSAATMHHYGVTDGQVLAAVVLVGALAVPFLGLSPVFGRLWRGLTLILFGGLLMCGLLVCFHTTIYHLPTWFGVLVAVVLLAMAVVFGSAHPSTSDVDAEFSYRSPYANALPYLAWCWPAFAVLGSFIGMAFLHFLGH